MSLKDLSLISALKLEFCPLSHSFLNELENEQDKNKDKEEDEDMDEEETDSMGAAL